MPISAEYLQDSYNQSNSSLEVPSAKEIAKYKYAERDEQNKYFNIMRSGSEKIVMPLDQNEDLKALLQPFRFALNASDYRSWRAQVNSLLASQYDEQGKYLGIDR